MKKEYIIVLLCFLLFVLGAMTLRPVHIPEDISECLITKGKVVRIYEGGIKDVVFNLEGDKTIYYINRGLEQGLDLEELQNELIGHEVTIYYPKYWSLLDPGNSGKHLSVLKFNGNEIFNEIKKKYPHNG